MARNHRERTGRLGAITWWALLIGWTCFIWGHSLKSGAASDEQSYQVVGILQRVSAWFALQDYPFVSRLLSEHPGIITRLSDSHLLNHYVRKGAHAGEFFVLGILAFNALRASLRNGCAFCLCLALVWCGVPAIDETIQRFVPNRSGQLSDILLDMSGFAVAVVLCLACAGVVALFREPYDG